MDFADPVLIATTLIALFGGLFLGRLLASRLIGGCLALVAGVLALVVVTRLLMGETVGFLEPLTENLSGLVAGQLVPVIAFVGGFLLGMAWGRRRG